MLFLTSLLLLSIFAYFYLIGYTDSSNLHNGQTTAGCTSTQYSFTEIDLNCPVGHYIEVLSYGLVPKTHPNLETCKVDMTVKHCEVAFDQDYFEQIYKQKCDYSQTCQIGRYDLQFLQVDSVCTDFLESRFFLQYGCVKSQQLIDSSLQFMHWTVPVVSLSINLFSLILCFTIKPILEVRVEERQFTIDWFMVAVGVICAAGMILLGVFEPEIEVDKFGPQSDVYLIKDFWINTPRNQVSASEQSSYDYDLGYN